jgi:hypothetical protein
MDSTLLNKNPSLLPRRNPAVDTDRTATHADVDAKELEAMNRLRQIEARTQFVSPRGPRRNPSVPPRDRCVARGDAALSSIDKDIAMTKQNAMNRPSTPETDDSKVDDDPLVQLKRERKQSVSPKPIYSHQMESKRNDDEVEGHTGASLPVRGFGRHESKVPTTTRVSSTIAGQEVQTHSGASLPVKAFGRHESKVPPNTAAQPPNDESQNVEKHTGNSLPVKAFGRHESKIPNSFVTTGEERRSDRPSIVPPSTMNRDEMWNTAGNGLSTNSSNCHSPKGESQPLDANHGNITPSNGKPPKPRKGFSLLPRAFRAKESSTDHSKDTPVKRMYSLHTANLPSFRRKQANLAVS